MIVTINGQEKSFTAPLNLNDCLEREGYADMMVAVARNGSFTPKGDYTETFLEDGDQIEIVAPMQGG